MMEVTKEDLERIHKTFEKFLDAHEFSFDGNRSFVLNAEFDKERCIIRAEIQICPDSGDKYPRIDEIDQ